MKEIIISKNEAEQRLDKFLFKYFPKAGSGFLYKMLRKKNITLNDRKASGSEHLAPGDRIKVFFSDETFAKFTGKSPKGAADAKPKDQTGVSAGNPQTVFLSGPSGKDYNVYRKAYETLKGVGILYESADLVFLDKPAGILSQTDQPGSVSLSEWLVGYLEESGAKPDLSLYKPSVCNRLDRNTSGIVICAKTYRASRILSELIRGHRLRKYYYALAEGSFEAAGSSGAGRRQASSRKAPGQTGGGGEGAGPFVDLYGYFCKDKISNKASVYGREEEIPAEHQGSVTPIHTRYRVRKQEQGLALLEVELVTGKSHQIRAHLASIGHPLAGDVKYGGHKISGVNYQMLHAARIEFPVLEEDELGISGLTIECAPPKRISNFLTTSPGCCTM